ncbi:MAG: hypothetical protein ACOYNI_07595 [Acidimicrobiia bacterium]
MDGGDQLEKLREFTRSMVVETALRHLAQRGQEPVTASEQSRITRAVMPAIRDGHIAGVASDRALAILEWLSAMVQETGLPPHDSASPPSVTPEALQELAQLLAPVDNAFDSASHLLTVAARLAVRLEPAPDAAMILSQYKRAADAQPNANARVNLSLELAGTLLRHGYRTAARRELDGAIVGADEIQGRGYSFNEQAERLGSIASTAAALLDLDAQKLTQAMVDATEGFRRAQRSRNPELAYEAGLVATVAADALGRTQLAAETFLRAVEYRMAPKVQTRSVEIDGRIRGGESEHVTSGVVLPGQVGRARFLPHPAESMLKRRFLMDAERSRGIGD